MPRTNNKPPVYESLQTIKQLYKPSNTGVVKKRAVILIFKISNSVIINVNIDLGLFCILLVIK